jgi:hypothetical protein
VWRSLERSESPCTEEADGSGAGFSQEGQSNKKSKGEFGRTKVKSSRVFFWWPQWRLRTSFECCEIGSGSALVEVLGRDYSTDLLPLDVTANEMAARLGGYDFHKFFPILLAEIPFEDSILPAGIPRRLVEQRVRRHG